MEWILYPILYRAMCVRADRRNGAVLGQVVRELVACWCLNAKQVIRFLLLFAGSRFRLLGDVRFGGPLHPPSFPSDEFFGKDSDRVVRELRP